MADTLLQEVIASYWCSWELERAREIPTVTQRKAYLRDQAVQAGRGSAGPGRPFVHTHHGHVQIFSQESVDSEPDVASPEWHTTYKERMAHPDVSVTIDNFVAQTLAYYGLDHDAGQPTLPGFDPHRTH